MNQELLKLDLTTFFLSISSAAIMNLNEGKENLGLAKQNIDLLELMKEKTKGNLSKDEEHLLEQLLFEVRVRFLEAQKRTKGK